jgi:serine protease AprX
MSGSPRLLSSSHHQQATLLIIILVCSSVFIPIFFIHSPILEKNNLATEDSKLASDLEQLAKLSTNQSKAVDIFASLEKTQKWKMAKQAILAQDPTIKIHAYHQLIHAISLQTTVGKLYNLAGLPEIRKLWSDICFNLYLPPSNPDQRSSSTYQSPQQSISASPLYAAGLNGSNTVVALLDTGIDITHPDLDDMDDNETTDDPKILGQVSFAEGDPFPFDLNGHGTYCAGLIAGTGNASGGMYTGIAPGAQLLGAKVLLSDGTGYSSWVIRGIEWSITSGADIIVLPFSTLGMPGDPLSQAVERAVEQGVIVIAAAGDRGPNHLTVMSPGESLAALTVGAYNTATQSVAEFSSRGPTIDMRTKPDIVAPGTDIISCSLFNIIPSEVGNTSFSFSTDDLETTFFGLGGFGEAVNNNYTRASTTAAAASIASGAACLLLQGARYTTPECLLIGVRQGAQPINFEPNIEGSGLLNVTATYQVLSSLHNPYPLGFRSRSITPGLPYYGFVTSQTDVSNATMLMSTYATTLAALVMSNTTNMTMIHMLMGMFYLGTSNSSPIPFALLNVEQEFHWTTLPMGTYTRATGILSYEDLLIIPRIESWQIADDPPSNAFRFSFYFLNIGKQPIEDLRLLSLWNFALFFGANDTSAQIGQFNNTNQLFHVAGDALPPNETSRIEQHIGLNATTAVSSFEVGPYTEVSDHLQDENLNNNSVYIDTDEIGFATRWYLGAISNGSSPHNVIFHLSFGLTEAAMIHGINETTLATLSNPQPDLCMIRVTLPRTGQPDHTYKTQAVIMNIGDSTEDSIAAFFTNQSQPQGGAIFARYFQLGNFTPFSYTTLTVEWNPEASDIYLAAWLAIPEISIDLFGLSTLDEHYPLDNIVLRDIFVNTPPQMRIVTPTQLPFRPMTIRFPNDYALYNLSILTSTPITHLEISIDALNPMAEWINFSTTEFNDIQIGTSVQMLVLVPPFIESGNYSIEIRFQSIDGWDTIIPFSVNIHYPKAVILFDTAHNQGLDFTNLDISNLGVLFEALAEMGDSVLTGYSRLRDLFAEADMNLTEIPQDVEVNGSLLSLFDGLILCDPEKGFTPEELNNLTQFIESGFKVLVLADNPTATNHTALNELLATQNIQLGGTTLAHNTTDLVPSSPFTDGVAIILVENGTYIQSYSDAHIFAHANNTAIGGYIGPDHHELFVFGCSATFANEYLFQLDNLHFANSTIHHLFRQTVEITIRPTGGNGSQFVIGNESGFIIDVVNRTGHGVEGLDIFVLYKMQNGSDLFFIAFEVKEGRYGSFLFANWTDNLVGRYTIIAFTMPSNFCSSIAFMYFEYIAAPVEPPPDSRPDYNFLMMTEITIAILGTIVVLAGYLFVYYQRRRQMRTPTIDEQIIQKIDNALNTTHALIRELEWTLTDRQIDRLEKLRVATGKTARRLEEMLKRLKELAKETGT